MALGITVVLIIFVASMIAYTTSGQRAATTRLEPSYGAGSTPRPASTPRTR